MKSKKPVRKTSDDIVTEALSDVKKIQAVAIERARKQLEESFMPRMKEMLQRELDEPEEEEIPTDETSGEEGGDESLPVIPDEEEAVQETDDMDTDDEFGDSDPGEDDMSDDEDINFDEEDFSEDDTSGEEDMPEMGTGECPTCGHSYEESSENDDEVIEIVEDEEEPCETCGESPCTCDDEMTEGFEEGPITSTEYDDELPGSYDTSPVQENRQLRKTNQKLINENKRLFSQLVGISKSLKNALVLNEQSRAVQNIFSIFSLSREQKKSVVEQIDKAHTINTIKLVSESIRKTLSTSKNKVNQTTGSASKTVKVVNDPNGDKKSLTESVNFTNNKINVAGGELSIDEQRQAKWLRLANIVK